MTDRYAVIGNPIEHSKSPQIHAAFARQTGQDMEYGKVLAPLEGFAATVEALRAQGYRGCNVTVPFKLEAFALAAERSARAQDAGAVNTLSFDGGRLSGDNTDGAGLVADITRNHATPIAGARVLLLGAGGAARGVIRPLLDAGPAGLTLANRSLDKALALQRHFGDLEICDFAGLSRQQFDVVINATSAGLSDAALPVPATVFAPGGLAYDMMYGRRTPFMQLAGEAGARVADGLGMLVEQAAEAFYLWRGIRPDTAPVIRQLRA
ncbi:MAG: shikimate dehydrogenase [Methylobacterium sp.]|nr:shikimate dehydrogenase [Methylobacterium sp.]